MAITLTLAAINVSNGNTFALEATADAYHETRPGSTWSALTTEQKKAALVHATRLLDVLGHWRGSRTAPAVQNLAFPRTGVQNVYGDAYEDQNSIPAWLANATSELAYQLTLRDRQSEGDAYGVESVKAGPVEVVFDAKDRESEGTLPDAVLEMCKHALENLDDLSGGGGPDAFRQVEVVRA